MKLKALLTISLLACILPLSSCGQTSESTTSSEIVDEGDGYVDSLPSDVNDGVILHAFTWKYNDIASSLDEIKDAGYRIVQTSPVTQPKSNGVKWEFFYQPLSYSISNDSPLGNKSELEALCSKAHEKGISIIVDIVFNHMATTGVKDSEGFYEIDPEVEKYEPEIYNNRKTYFHRIANPIGSGTVTMQYSGLPDIDTSNAYIQERSLSLLKECIDVGVDGFRFDAAKHIETPDDPNYASNFWPNTLEVAKKYYKEKTGNELFAYGEILNDLEGGRDDYSIYTKYMKITDNGYCDNVVKGIIGKRDGSIAANAKYTKNGVDASKLITWVESHDTYLGSSATKYKNNIIARLWSVIASRKGTNPLYFARVDESNTVGKIGDYGYESELVASTNRFHNRFIDADEYISGEKDYYAIEKVSDDDYGSVVIDINGKETLDVTLTHLKDGIYWDALTGKEVMVKEGKANIEFDSSRISILTRTKKSPRPDITISKRDISFGKNFDVTITVKNATSMSYQFNDGEAVSFDGTITLSIGDNVEAGNDVILKVKASNADYSKEISTTYSKIKLIDGGFNIINFDMTLLTNYKLYYWAWGKGAGSWYEDYTVIDNTILIDFSNTSNTGFLLALFNKGYEITNKNKWDENCLVQTPNILISEGFYDASQFTYGG